MVIDWSVTQVYNTIMSVSTGIILLLVVMFIRNLQRSKIAHLDGWAIGFAIPGFILTITGMHMTLTWPLSQIGFPFDDIIFGEPTFAFGVIALGASTLLWRKSNQYIRNEIDIHDTRAISGKLKEELPHVLKPASYFAAAMGYALISIAIAGVTYQLFAAPPEEPISGAFADYPLIEAIFISGLYAITGIGAAMLPFILREKPNRNSVKIVTTLFFIAGSIFVAFGVMNYFTHIGLIVNTM